MSLIDDKRESVRMLVDDFVAIWDGSDFGPAHIALSDYNLLDSDLEFCSLLVSSLIHGGATEEQKETYADRTSNELEATQMFLDMLTLIPEDWRDIHAEAVENNA